MHSSFISAYSNRKINTYYLHHLYYHHLLGQEYFPVYSNNTIQDCIFQENMALFGSGGSIYSDNHNNIIIKNSIMKQNKALDGGAIYLNGFSSLYFEDNNTFIQNQANRIGGAIACCTCYLFKITLHTILNISRNEANRGSAIYLNKLMIESTIFDFNTLYIENNHAYIGGTIYWIYDKDGIMNVSPNINQSTIIHNYAPYGNVIGTQSIYLSGPTYYNVSTNIQRNVNNNTLIFIAYDYYYQQLINVDDNEYIFLASIDDEYKMYCLGHTPSIIR